jgi:hypothetical protein
MGCGDILRKILAISIVIALFTGLFTLDTFNGSTVEEEIEHFSPPIQRPLQAEHERASQLPTIVFTENLGQLKNEDIKFYIQGGGLWFKDNSIWFEISENEDNTNQVFDKYNNLIGTNGGTISNPKRVILKQTFVDSNDVIPVGTKQLGWFNNYFYGNDPLDWRTGVSNYNEIYYENLFDGIDLRYYSNEKGLKYDFIVHPGGNIDKIRIRYEGAVGLEVDLGGNLKIQTEIGDLLDRDLSIYQEENGVINTIEGKFVVKNNFEYGFNIISDYNPEEDLIIDPVIEFASYLGGSHQDEDARIAVDPDGGIYITGETNSVNFPTTSGALDSEYNDPYTDIFVVKFEGDASEPSYATYVGGNGSDLNPLIKVDGGGYAYVAGNTDSDDFPTTPNAYNRLFVNLTDIYALKLNPTGAVLSYSTYIGADKNDYVRDIALGVPGNLILTGYTSSDDFPVKNPLDANYNGGIFDIFITKLQTDGSDLIFSTYFGGDGRDRGNAITIDVNGNIFLTGDTGSDNFPISSGSFNSTNQGGYDGFITKLSASGTSMVFSTFIGGSDWDTVDGITLDANNDIFITGNTRSFDFPTTYDAINRIIEGGKDIFICKFNQMGTSLRYSTFIGGSGDDEGNDIVIDTFDNICVIGYTLSPNFYITENAYDRFIGGREGFYLRMISTGEKIIYSTFLGGDNDDYCTDIDIDTNGNVYIAGHTLSANFPVSKVTYDSILNGVDDTFFVKFSTPVLEINSITILEDNIPVSKIYSKYAVYSFKVMITNTESLIDLEKVTMILDSKNHKIKLEWARASNHFIKDNDHRSYITLESSSQATNDSQSVWYITFDLTFNWNYPDEDPRDISISAESESLDTVSFEAPNMYHVENDLEFDGELSVKKGNGDIVDNNDPVKYGEKLIWTGLILVYENTIDIYPSPDYVGFTIWEEIGISHSDSPAEGQLFNIETTVPSLVDTNGYVYIINISGIPEESDKTSESFSIFIDGEGVKYTNPKPDPLIWHSNKLVEVGITVSDDLSGVDGTSIEYALSENAGSSWSQWYTIGDVPGGGSIDIKLNLVFTHGEANRIKWRASDLAGNGPVESQSYIVKTNLHTFDVEVKLEPEIVDVIREDLKSVTVKVTNIGDLTDTISLKIYNPPGNYIKADISGENSKVIEPWETVSFEMRIAVSWDAELTDEIIRVQAVSGQAQQFGLEISKNATLTVQVKEKQAEPMELASFETWVSIILVIVIVVILLILFLMIKMKKDQVRKQLTSQPKSYVSKPQPAMPLQPQTGPVEGILTPIPNQPQAQGSESSAFPQDIVVPAQVLPEQEPELMDLDEALEGLKVDPSLIQTGDDTVVHDGDTKVWLPGEEEKDELTESKEVIEQLEILGDLKEKGIITDEEFQRKKDELLK